MLSQVVSAVEDLRLRPSVCSSASPKASTLHLVIWEMFKIWGRGTDMCAVRINRESSSSQIFLFLQCEETSACNSACNVLRGGRRNTDMADVNGNKITEQLL